MRGVRGTTPYQAGVWPSSRRGRRSWPIRELDWLNSSQRRSFSTDTRSNRSYLLPPSGEVAAACIDNLLHTARNGANNVGNVLGRHALRCAPIALPGLPLGSWPLRFRPPHFLWMRLKSTSEMAMGRPTVAVFFVFLWGVRASRPCLWNGARPPCDPFDPHAIIVHLLHSPPLFCGHVFESRVLLVCWLLLGLHAGRHLVDLLHGVP